MHAKTVRLDIRASDEDRAILAALAARLGTTQTAVVWRAVRELDHKERHMTNEDRVLIVLGGVRCPIHGLVKGAEFGEQHPAPCGCTWAWDENDGTLRALSFRGPFCDCGAPLPPPPHAPRENSGESISQCPACGRHWRFYYSAKGLEHLHA